MAETATTWRVIRTAPASGAWNMALDEALLMSAAAKTSPPTLRFFDWAPPCLSLGYSQSADDVDHTALAAHGFGLVRRPTGGRAILHVDELTYSVALPDDDPLVAGGIVESYQRLSRALMRGLETLGLQVQSEPAEDSASRHQGAVCFEVPSHYEITANGRKLIGSAQVRRHGGVLQHGTLPLHGDIGRIVGVLAFDSAERRDRSHTRVYERATTLETVLGRRTGWAEAADAMQAAFAAEFGVALVVAAGPETSELAAAERLMATRYANAEYTFAARPPSS